jgi:hypothetical protein
MRNCDVSQQLEASFLQTPVQPIWVGGLATSERPHPRATIGDNPTNCGGQHKIFRQAVFGSHGVSRWITEPKYDRWKLCMQAKSLR